MKKLFLFLFFFFLIIGTRSFYTQWYSAGLSLPPYPWTVTGGVFFSSCGLWIGAPLSLPQKIYSSLDTGKTWTVHTFTDNSLGGINAIHFYDRLNGIINAGNGVEITSDGGKTWDNFFGIGGNDCSFLGSANTIIRVTGNYSIDIFHSPFNYLQANRTVTGLGSYFICNYSERHSICRA